MKFKAAAELILVQVLMSGIAWPSMMKADARDDRLASQHFFCNTGYTLEACHEQIAVLKTVVGQLPTKALGEWTWVLVRSDDWKRISKTLGIHPESPAFTCLEKKTTFVEEALVAEVPGRARELVLRWHMGITELLNAAVEHEMAHALCHTWDENKANRVAKILEQKRPLSCQSQQ